MFNNSYFLFLCLCVLIPLPQDNAIADALAFTNESKTILFKADWENKTTDKLRQKRKDKRVNQLLAEQRGKLLQRKRALAALLNAEMNGWQKEMMAEKETPEDRLSTLQNRAIALRDSRETERRKFVDRMYHQQWQLSCDDGRLLDSKATIKQVVQDRETQIAQKAEIAKKIQAEANQLDQEYKRRVAELAAKEDAKEKYMHDLNMEIKGILDEQVVMMEARRQALRDQKAMDAAEEMKEWQEAKDREDAKEAARYAEAKARGLVTRKFNETRLGIREQHEAETRRQDRLLLQYALDKEEAEKAAEKAKADEEKATTKRYEEYLKLQMVKEAADESAADALRKADEDRVMERREKEQQDRRDARAYLWKITDEGRQEQIHQKYEAERKFLEDEAALDVLLGGGQDELDEIERQKQERHKKAVMINQLGVRQQAAYRQRMLRKEKQDAYLEGKIMRKVEKEHSHKLTTLSGTVKTRFPNKHTQWYS